MLEVKNKENQISNEIEILAKKKEQIESENKEWR